MTTKTLEPGTPIAPFLLLDFVARGGSYRGGRSEICLMTDGYSNDDPGFDDVITAGFLACEEAGWIEVIKDESFRNQIAYRMTEAGESAHAGTDLAWVRDTFGVSPSGKLPSPGDRALWLWLIRFGGVMGSYATSPESANSNLMHIRACGLDFDRSGSVTDTTWTTWGGTFAEDGREKGVGGEAVCRCGAVGGVDRRFGSQADGTERPRGGGRLEVVAELSSYVDLLRAMIL